MAENVVLVVLLVLSIGAVAVAAITLDAEADRHEPCKLSGGVMVKTWDGWMCIKAVPLTYQNGKR